MSEKESSRKRSSEVSGSIPPKCKLPKFDRADLESRPSTSTSSDESSYQDFKEETATEKIQKALETSVVCTICYEVMIKPMALSCSHCFCEHCLLVWKKKQNKCPVCREFMTSMIELGNVNDMIEKFVGMLDQDFQDKRKEITIKRKKAAAEEIDEIGPTFIIEAYAHFQAPDTIRLCSELPSRICVRSSNTASARSNDSGASAAARGSGMHETCSRCGGVKPNDSDEQSGK